MNSIEQANHKSGFTLVEILLVVVLIGLLAAMAMPAFTRVRERSQNARLANDFRIYVGSIETFIAETGTYPENSNTGAIPAGVSPYLRAERWGDTAAIGGSWDVEKDSYGVRSAIGIQGFTASVEQLKNFDETYDDGDLSSGNYRRLAADRYYYIVAE